MNHLTAYDSSSSEGEEGREDGGSTRYLATGKATPPELNRLCTDVESIYAGGLRGVEAAVTPRTSGAMQQEGDHDWAPPQGHHDVGVASHHVGVASDKAATAFKRS